MIDNTEKYMHKLKFDKEKIYEFLYSTLSSLFVHTIQERFINRQLFYK